MKEQATVKKWQLVRYRTKKLSADLRECDVVSVGKRALYKSRVEEVVLPSRLSAVKAEAFAGCQRLKRVTLPSEGSVGISYGVFRGCGRLSQIENAHAVVSVGEKAFADCVMLRRVDTSRALRRIGNEAFRGCHSLASVALTSSLDYNRILQVFGGDQLLSYLCRVLLHKATCNINKLLRVTISMRNLQLSTRSHQFKESCKERNIRT